MRDKIAQAKYIKERIVKRKSIRKAAKAAGVPLRTAARAEKDPEVFSEMRRALDKAKATTEKIAQTVAEGLDAEKYISCNIIVKGDTADKCDGMKDADGVTKDFIPVPDFIARKQFAELAGKFRGDFIERVEHSGSVDLDFASRLDAAKKRSVEAMIARRRKA